MDPITPQQQDMPPKQKTFTPKFIALLVLLVVLGLGAAAGVWYWQTSHIPAVVAVPVHKPAADPTANWKTYTNDQYGFSFKYPSDWTLQDQSNADPNPQTKFNTIHINNDNSYIEFTSSLTRDAGLANYANPGQDMELDGVSWHTHRDMTGLGENYPALILDTSYQNKFYEIVAYPSVNQVIGSDLNQILSTFKFITPVATAPTYTNDQYGFSIALPDSWNGYTVLNSQWQGRNVAIDTVTSQGPIITLRHPLWTAANPREDMPIMIFTPAQWAMVESETIAVGAAPIPPSVLGQNSKYILALPARYNFDYKTGWQEVDQLVHTLKAYEPK